MRDNEPIDPQRPVFAFLTSHWLGMLGSALVTIAGCSWLFLVVLHAGGGAAANPYLGILIFLVIPAVFFLGLILIPIGAWLARRQIRAGLAVAQSRRTVLRRLGYFFAAMTVVNVVIASQVTYRGVTYMEKDQFCGQTCHVMKPQFIANRRSVHRNVGCVDCHVVPGAAGFAEAKASGVRQLFEVTLNDYPRPVPPALQTNRLVSSAETCEQCHSRTTDSGSQLVVIPKFKDDEANTPIQTVLIMNVGGGRSGGIHGAHMGPGVEIRYRATDPDRQIIPSVEYRNTITHDTRTYTAPGVSDKGAQEFLMECADCHNRSGHAFQQPDEAVDGAMAAGRIPVGLPFAHKTGIGILNVVYSSDDDAARRIPAAFAAFYEKNYPDIAAKQTSEIKQAGQTLLALYNQNAFPDLGVKWGTYKNNLGHADNAGCFRCHDGNHATPQKATITQDCSVCHNPLAVEETSPAVLTTLGIEQKLMDRLKK